MKKYDIKSEAIFKLKDALKDQSETDYFDEYTSSFETGCLDDLYQ
jgi:hypothetical protein